MKAVTLISTAALAAILATETDAKSALAEIVEEATAPTFALKQDYGDEYGDEAEEELETADADEEGEADAEDEEGEDEDLEIDFDPAKPGGEVWGWINWSQGLLTGVFGPLSQRLRSYDCFSESYTLGDELMRMHWMWLAQDYTDIFTLVWWGATGILNIWGGVRWAGVCKDEYLFRVGNPYRIANLAGSTDAFTDVDEGFDVGFDIVYLLAILRDGASTYFALMAFGWDHYEFIHPLATGVTRLVMFIDKMGVGVIKPTKPWSRYLK